MKNSLKFFTLKFKNRRSVFILLGALLIIVFAASLIFGTVYISPAKLFGIFAGSENETAASRIVLFSRLPRVCGCILAGAALAVSGAVIQSVLANPLAAPNIIGVNSGAGLCVVLSCAITPTALYLVPFAAFLGALLGVLLVLFIAEKTGASKITLVLAGVAVSSIFSAGIDAAVTFFPDSLVGYSDFRIGGLSNITFSRMAPAFFIVILSLAVIFSLSNEIDVMMLGADTAKSLGLPAKKLRLLLLALSAALAGSAVSFAGLLGFVGLIVPHIMRRLMGEESSVMFPACALGGAVLLSVCDLLSRTVFSPFELPVGIMLSLIGGPFFIWLLFKQRGGRTHD